MMDVGDRIREARLAKGMTQEELSKALGLASRSSVNKIEKNAYTIGLERIKEIAKALDVDPDYLVFGDVEDKKDRIRQMFNRLTDYEQDIALAYLEGMIAKRESGQ